MEESPYAIRIRTPMPYTEAKERATQALKSVGFGVQWQIDVKQGLKELVGAEWRPYTIMGTCDPKLAHRALEQELEVGLMLPCTAIVYEADGGSVVAVLDPEKLLGLTDNPRLAEVAAEARRRLESALRALEAGPEG